MSWIWLNRPGPELRRGKVSFRNRPGLPGRLVGYRTLRPSSLVMASPWTEAHGPVIDVLNLA